jgi:hypothetical protein
MASIDGAQFLLSTSQKRLCAMELDTTTVLPTATMNNIWLSIITFHAEYEITWPHQSSLCGIYCSYEQLAFRHFRQDCCIQLRHPAQILRMLHEGSI